MSILSCKKLMVMFIVERAKYPIQKMNCYQVFACFDMPRSVEDE